MDTILFISPTGTLDNGAEISTYYLMQVLVEKGYRVLNIVPGYGVDSQKYYIRKMQDIGVEMHPLETRKWWWEDAPGGKPGTFRDRNIFYRKNMEEVIQIIKRENVVCVVSNTVNVFQGALAAAFTHVPHIWLIHEFPKNEFSYYENRISFIDQSSDAVFAVSGQLTSFLTPLFSQEIASFFPYNDVSALELQQGEKVRLVSIGRLTPGKNQLELIKAFSQLNREDLELVFIGGWDEEYKKLCDDFVESNDLDRIQFLGHQDDPWSMVTNHDVAVFTSSMETFGLVFVEALLHGVPVIAADNPGFESVFEIFHGGELYPLGDVEALRFKIEEYLYDFDNRKMLAKSSVEKHRALFQKEEAYGAIIQKIQELSKSKRKKGLNLSFFTFLIDQTEDSKISTKIMSKLRGLKRLLRKR